MLERVRRSRLHLVTGGHDAAEETPCAHCARGRHVGASARRCAQVRAYAYSSPNLSLCERLFLNAFWDERVRAIVPDVDRAEPHDRARPGRDRAWRTR